MDRVSRPYIYVAAEKTNLRVNLEILFSSMPQVTNFIGHVLRNGQTGDPPRVVSL